MENILRAIFSAKKKADEKTPVICTCSHCKEEIDTDNLYLRFTGELLHAHCLIEYMQKLNILDVVAPHGKGESACE